MQTKIGIVIYLLGLVSNLVWEAWKHIRADRKEEPTMSIWACLKDWFFETSLSNESSWLMSLGGVGLVGAIAVHNLGVHSTMTEYVGGVGAGITLFLAGVSADKIGSQLAERLAGAITGKLG